jgi:hypothetical protein
MAEKGKKAGTEKAASSGKPKPKKKTSRGSERITLLGPTGGSWRWTDSGRLRRGQPE